MLEETRDQEFPALVKRWRGHCGRIVGHLDFWLHKQLAGMGDVELRDLNSTTEPSRDMMGIGNVKLR